VGGWRLALGSPEIADCPPQQVIALRRGTLAVAESQQPTVQDAAEKFEDQGQTPSLIGSLPRAGSD
jgi:hypothetical protein